MNIDSLSYSEFFRGIWESWKHFYRENTQLPTWEYIGELRAKNQITLGDVITICILAMAMSLLRVIVTKYFFQPIGRYYQLKQENREKFPESAWKFIFYSLAWSFEFYVVVIKYNIFQKSFSLWDNWSLDDHVESDIKALHIIQISFYLHSLHTMAVYDTTKKDFYLLLIHHFLTLLLLGISIAFNYAKFGALTLFLHDLSDVQLEFSKLNIYFKHRNQKTYRINEIITQISFIAFTITWFVLRMHYYPLRTVYGFCVIPLKLNIMNDLPLMGIIQILVSILFIFNTAWSLVILHFLYKMLTGQLKDIEDTREYVVVCKEDKIESSQTLEKSKEMKIINKAK